MVSIALIQHRTIVAMEIAILLTAGCAHAPSAVPTLDQSSGRQMVETALQEAKMEAAALRSDLATARITAAKQEAELRELRRQVEEVQQVVEAKQIELITLQNERDRRERTATIAQVQIADSTAPPASTADMASLQTKLCEMESALAALTVELAQMKKEMARPASGPTR